MPGTRFFCVDQEGRLTSWAPPEPVEGLVDSWYFGQALAAMDAALAVDGLTVYMTFDADSVPSHGDDVVVVFIGDEWARVPAYLPHVRAVFRNCCARPHLGCSPLAWPSPETLAPLLPAARAAVRGLPGRLARVRAELAAASGRGPRPAPQVEVPIGTFNALELPLTPLRERRADVFFAGSVAHDPGAAAWKARVKPKGLAREAMVRNVERLRRHAEVTVDVRITESFQESADADPGDYSRGLMDARLALVPRGATTETHRFLQALKYGCIPVTDSTTPVWFYERAPAVRLRHWDELEDAVLALLGAPARLERMHAEALAWWHEACAPEAVGRLMARTLNALG